jgi:RHS repeat-associated protein
MQPNRETLLCRYHYDPLDRLADCTPAVQATTRRFYLKDRLATEIQGAVQRSIMQHEDQLLAQQQHQSGVVDTRLLVTDQQRSVLNVLNATRLNPLAYAPYGHRPAENGPLSLLGFNGERPDPVTGCYLLGNGYRAFNPVLMRFNSPDSWSPFGEGGLNGYAYCVGDPVNESDRTGHMVNPNNFTKSLRSTTSLSTRPLSTRPQGSISNIRRVSDEMAIYDDIYKGKPRLNIDAHGIDTPTFKSTRVSLNGELLDAKGLLSEVEKHVNPKEYSNVRLLICHSANGGTDSLAARISQLSNKPTKGFIGEVIVENELELLTTNGLVEQKRIRMQTDKQRLPIVVSLIDKSRNYKPRKFYP